MDRAVYSVSVGISQERWILKSVLNGMKIT